MEYYGAGAYLMVKKITLSFILFYSCFVNAQISLSMNRNLWQENVAVSYNDTKNYQLTTFSSWSFGAGYDFYITKRYIYAPSIEYHFGDADVHKIDETLISPRKKFSAIWFNNPIIYRVTKTFNIGLSSTFNYRSGDGLGKVLSAGLIFLTEYELFDDVMLNQNIGTFGNSNQISYSVGLSRVF